MKIDHIGYAVKRMDRAKAAFQDLGFTFAAAIDDTDRNVKLAFGEKDGYRIELVSPLDKDKDSPVDTYLSKFGPMPYHFCYQSEDLDREIGNLTRQGFRVVIAPEKAVAFGGARVVFMMNLSVGLLEIVEKNP